MIYVYSESKPEENDQETPGTTFKCSILDPCKGNVAFGAGRDWAFTLTQFAKFYNKKRKNPSGGLKCKLWGENYFNNETNKWQTNPFKEETSSKKLNRGFVQFILEPIYKV